MVDHMNEVSLMDDLLIEGVRDDHLTEGVTH